MHAPMQRRQLIALPFAAAGAALGSSLSMAAETFPSKPIGMVVPFPAGGPTDIVARPMALLLGKSLKQSVFIDSRSGAGGSIGAGMVAQAPADGYTLLMGTVGTSAINTALYKNLPYDAIRDFTPLATVANAPLAIVVHPASGLTSVADLIARAKAKPGSLSYGSAGNGTPGHLAAAMFCAEAGIQLLHIPYKGSSPAITDLIGGQIPLMFDPLQSLLPHLQSGKLKALAVTSRERTKVLPDVPTISESALPGFEATAWWAMFAPSKLPADIALRLTTEIQRIVRGPEFERSFASLGVAPMDVPLAEFQKSETARWGAAVRATGIYIE